MTQSEVTAGQYLAVPFAFNPRREAVNEALLTGCLHLPNLFPIPMTELEQKTAIASWLTNPNNLFWEAWLRGSLIGILGLTEITAGLDARAHLAFFDKQLVGRQHLLLTMIRWSFENLDLQRLTIEIPEHLEPLIRFCRAKLGFRYEGESLAVGHPIAKQVPRNSEAATVQWIVKVGSRRERAHWSGTEWKDLARLRITRNELTGLLC